MQRVQFNSHTHMFRQTEQLKTARARLLETKPDRRLKILSFGCSIGDEIATIKFLFPHAEVFGCDINEKILSIAEKTVGGLATVFLSSEGNLREYGPFDLVIASAVLCVNPSPPDMAAAFPVSQFDEMLDQLDRQINDGGILILTNAAYRFVESPVGAKYRTIRSDIVLSNGVVDVFDRTSQLYLTRKGRTLGGVVLRRHGSFVPRDDEDVADSVFEKRNQASGDGDIVSMRLAAPPDDISVLNSFTRLNSDTLIDKPLNRFIAVESEYQLCRSESLGCFGYVLSTRWSSLTAEGFHRRPATWHPLD